MALTTRGRPAIIDKAELTLADGTSVTLSLVGDGDTLQLTLPSQWNVESFSRSVTASGGRTKVSFLATTKPKAAAKPRKKAAPKPTADAKPAAATDDAPKRKRGRPRKTEAAA